jgi:L-alanine-DL-glutamate epimerase-like enolase superfamily enzyme
MDRSASSGIPADHTEVPLSALTPVLKPDTMPEQLAALDPVIIEHVTSHHLRIPVRPLRVDSQSILDTWDVIVVSYETANGLTGWGYQCGFGPIMGAIHAFIRDSLLPDIKGLDARKVIAWWHKRFLMRHHMGLDAPLIQGVSSPEVAAWDLCARSAGVPLWKLLGEKTRDRVPCYDTHCGWLGYPFDELVDNMRRSKDAGFRGVKVKIGSDEHAEDMRRLTAVRDVVGPDFLLATDVNNKWDLAMALDRAPDLADLDIAWLEEPLYPFDIDGHARLKAAIDTPVLHGESICDPVMFRDMINAHAIDIVQPSEMKLSGIARWLETAELARAAGKPLVPAGWTFMQIVQHLASVTPEVQILERMSPWIDHILAEPAMIEDGQVVVSDAPGAGTAILPEALETFAV